MLYKEGSAAPKKADHISLQFTSSMVMKRNAIYGARGIGSRKVRRECGGQASGRPACLLLVHRLLHPVFHVTFVLRRAALLSLELPRAQLVQQIAKAARRLGSSLSLPLAEPLQLRRGLRWPPSGTPSSFAWRRSQHEEIAVILQQTE
eukprot:scaffold564_cov248-Pinguiococcus_pyrenoidosus.AAC.16